MRTANRKEPETLQRRGDRPLERPLAHTSHSVQVSLMAQVSSVAHGHPVQQHVWQPICLSALIDCKLDVECTSLQLKSHDALPAC